MSPVYSCDVIVWKRYCQQIKLFEGSKYNIGLKHLKQQKKQHNNKVHWGYSVFGYIPNNRNHQTQLNIFMLVTFT